MSDRLEIQDTLTRYCTAIDSGDYDGLDSVFTADAFIDYTSAGGVKGTLPEIKEWLAQALERFPVTQHAITNFSIQLDGDTATSRCAFYNPMGLRMPAEGDKLSMLFFGGYYNDKLVRVHGDWRISERIEESVWKYGEFPEGSSTPEQ
ncbi:MAG: nuclear transport factor 2 family protein [Dehalococcoidia bacterium]